jgi:predicted methyltransferase
MSGETKSKRGKANHKAWEAAKKVVKTDFQEHKNSKWKKELWAEIRRQLRRTGTFVDLTAVPVYWTNESQQMRGMCTVLKKAGFKQDKHLYYWPD